MNLKIVKTFRDLLVWQKAMQFITDLYRGTRYFPKEETFGLTSQIRRSAISIPSNIAEGFGRRSTDDYLRFLQIAVGSLFEIQTQLEISKNLEYLATGEFEKLYESSREIERMLVSMIHKTRKPQLSGSVA
jgi:four helix bundle protein